MPEEIVRYLIKPSAESTFTLEVSKTGLMAGKKHFLFFEQYSGEVDYDPQHPENSRVSLTVEARSVTCKDAWVKITGKSKGQYEIQGNLTVRGITKPIAFAAAAKPSGIERLEIDGDAQINLKDYGLTPPSAMLGLIGAKSKMTLRFLVWAEKTSA